MKLAMKLLAEQNAIEDSSDDDGPPKFEDLSKAE